MCSKTKIVAVFVSIQAQAFSTTGRAKPSFCSKEDKYTSKENARNLHFSLLPENGGSCFGVVFFFKANIFLPVLSSSIACRTPLAAPPLAEKSSLNALLQPNPAKANSKLRIMCKVTSGSRGRGQKDDSVQGEGSTPQLPRQDRTARLLARPPPWQPASNHRAWSKDHPRSYMSRNSPKYLKKAMPA